MSDCPSHEEDIDLGLMGRAVRVWHIDGECPDEDAEAEG